MVAYLMNLGFSNWISLFALLISAISLVIVWYHKKTDEKKIDKMTRETTLQILNDAKYILQNPPSNGFDYTPNIPFFRIDKLDECLSDKDNFSKHEFKLIKDARDALYQAKILIDEVNSLEPSLKQNVKFRQRFPEVKEDCINKVETCLTIEFT